ncbi:MAG: HAMP domain-containing histidine kinase [Lachnospiraceae bacterium]|nr:HAMP domain-containing histidine kinase [Lachnospiraceae bacterium]
MKILLFVTLQVFVFFGSYIYFRHKYILLIQSVCNILDNVIYGQNDINDMYMETLSSKIRSKLNTIIEMTNMSREQAIIQKQEIQQIISDISHQLKTPVSNILMYSSTLEENGLSDNEKHQFFLVLKEQTQKLEFLIQSLIKMSRLESHMLIMKRELSPVFPVISKAVSSILPSADKKNLEIEVRCPEELSLFFDPKWTEEAIFNVLDNAVKYTPANGRIVLTVETMQFYTRIKISDTGTGIQPEHQCDIFKRFYRESKVHKKPGTGTGLYITREILERQDGYITVNSVPDKGSSFSIFLPNRNIK